MFFKMGRLTKTAKHDKLYVMKAVDIDIDELTNCLVDRKTGKTYETDILEIIIRPSDYNGWKFDWALEAQNDVKIYALKIKGQNKTQGLISTRIDYNSSSVFVSLAESAPDNVGSNGRLKGVGGHLFAEAVRQSMEAGFGGHVYFISKTHLFRHYEVELGAKLLRKNTMFIDEESAKILYERYYGTKKS